MTRRLVLADASVLIEAVQEQGDEIARERVRQLLAEDRLAVWEVTTAELLVGARNESDYQRLSDRLLGIHMLHPPENVWLRAARLGYELRRQGHTVPLADLATAIVAMHNDADLLHRDRHFSVIAGASNLREEYVGPPCPEQ